MTARPQTDVSTRVDTSESNKRIPLSQQEGFIPLTIHDAPLTQDQLRAILGPHVDDVMRRLRLRLAQRRAERKMGEETAS